MAPLIATVLQTHATPVFLPFLICNGNNRFPDSFKAVDERNPRLVTLVEIANALEIPLHELLELEKIESVKNTVAGRKITDKK